MSVIFSTLEIHLNVVSLVARRPDFMFDVLNCCMLCSFQGYNCGYENNNVCSLFAMNPKTSKMICLESFCFPKRSVIFVLVFCSFYEYTPNYRNVFGKKNANRK